jgi:hypothetical protein
MTLRRELSWHAVVTVMATHLVVMWHAASRPFLNIPEYLAGVGKKPYQFRALPGFWARPIVALLDGVGVSASLAAREAPFNSAATLAFMALHIPCAVWLTREVRAWLRDGSGSDELGFWAAPAVLVVLPANLYAYNQSNFHFPYDLPAVAFMFALLRLAARDRWGWFYALFPIATLNRETTFMVTLVCVLANRTRWRAGVLVAHAASQLVLWVAVKVVLLSAYRANPSEGRYQVLANMLSLNLSYLSKPIWWPQVLSTMAFLWVPCAVFWRRHEDPMLRAALSLFPAYAALMLVIGQIVEIRIFAEFTPVFFCSAVLLAWRAVRGREATPAVTAT